MSNPTSRIPRSSPKWAWIVLLLLLSLTVAACGGGDEASISEEMENTTTPVPTVEIVPTESPAQAAPVPPMPDPEYLPPGKVLKSFRARSESIFSTLYADGTEEEEHAIFNNVFVRTDGPFGFDEVLELIELGHGHEHEASAEEPMPDMVIYSVDDGMAVGTGDQWSVAPRDGMDQPSPAFEVFTGLPGDFGSAIDEATVVGQETVNGVETVHYRVDDQTIFESLLGVMLNAEDGEVRQLSYDVWIAQEAKFVVKYDFVIQVANAQTTDLDGNPVVADEISARWQYELFDVNEEITIEWPADAPRPGQISLPGFAPGEFPIPPGAQTESTMFGIITLVSPEDAASVAAFYEEALVDLGWTMEGEGGFYNWSKDDAAIAMVIGPDEQGSGSRITIIPD